MRITLLAILLFSASLSAQQKIRKPLMPRTDSVRVYKMDSKTIQQPQKSDQRNLYKMPSAKPKEGTVYSGLKNNKTDHNDYKMLNSIAPEAPKKEEKELPSTSK
ncbi:hypothetical protein [Chryseobacterium gambrini]|uniref:hypothetical protein n=1 Tax=Chryseobacterium gambrini TaxID=373672 RepID=UPI003D110A97